MVIDGLTRKIYDMKNLRYAILTMTAGVVLLLAHACKNDDGELALKRMFRPATIDAKSGTTKATISWSAALFTDPGTATYVVEVSRDSVSFSPVVFTDTTQNLSVDVTDQDVAVRQTLYARVKTLGLKTAEESKWELSSAFSLSGEQLFTGLPSTDIGDVAVIFHWASTPGLTKLVLTPAGGGAPIEIALTAPESSGGLKEVTGLTPGTSYTAEIFEGAASKGILTFKTQTSISGNLIHLENITGRPNVLIDTLSQIPAGSVVILKRGFTYSVAASYAFTKTVTIVSNIEPGVPDQAKIYITNPANTGSSVSFNVALNSNIDSLVFSDVYMYTANWGASYVLNINNACTIGKLKFDNCRAEFIRGFARMQASGAGAKVTTLLVNNCVVDSVREYGIATASGASNFSNIIIQNSTFYKMQRFLATTAAGTNASILVQNCTFNEVPTIGNTAANNLLIDCSTFAVPVVVQNCIFGRTKSDPSGTTSIASGIRTAGSVTTTSNYTTSDFVITTPGVSPSTASYTKPSTTLWTDPAHGIFTFKDLTYPATSSTGDPRWRP